MKKSKSLFSCLIAFALIVSIFKFNTFSVSATPAPMTKATIGSLDLNSLSSVDKLDTEGYKWEAETKTLTLDGINIEVTADLHGLIFDDDLNIVLTKDSVNKIFFSGDYDQAALMNINPDPDITSKLTLSGEGSLDIIGPVAINCEFLGIKSGNYTFTSNAETWPTVVAAEYFNMSGGIVDINCEGDDAIGLVCNQFMVSGGELNISIDGNWSLGINGPDTSLWANTPEADQFFSVSGGKINIEITGEYPDGIAWLTNIDISGGDISILSDYTGLSCYTLNMTGGHFISTTTSDNPSNNPSADEPVWHSAIVIVAEPDANYTDYKNLVNLGDKIEIKQGGHPFAVTYPGQPGSLGLACVSFTNLAKEYMDYTEVDKTTTSKTVELGEKKIVPTPEPDDEDKPDAKPVDNVKPDNNNPSTNPNTNAVDYEVVLLLLSGLFLGALIIKKKACRQ